MNFYEVGYLDWESTPITTLCHDKSFTKDEFNEILLQAYVKANDILKKSHQEWFNDWLEDVIQKDQKLDPGYIDDMRYKPEVSELNHKVIDILLSEYGFKNISITQRFIPNNSTITNVENSGYKCELVDMIKNRFLVVEEIDNKLQKILKK